ncbi:hypothetical protein [Endozoicomonas numazuensis]|nr:hypothetical protein [Endozoicomonas numazuensis]
MSPEARPGTPELMKQRRELLIADNNNEAVRLMKGLITAIQEEDIGGAFQSLYEFRQALVLKTALERKGEFDVADLMEYAEVSIDSLELNHEALSSLKGKEHFLAELTALIRIMDSARFQGELASSKLSKSALACLGRQNPLLIVQQKLFPGFDLADESAKLSAAEVGPIKLNQCFAALYNSRTRLEEEMESLVESIATGAVEHIPMQIDYLLEAIVEEINERGGELDQDHILGHLRNALGAMVLSERKGEAIRQACLQKDSKFLQFMASVQERMAEPAESEFEELRRNASMILNDLICRQVDLGEDEVSEAWDAANNELNQARIELAAKPGNKEKKEKVTQCETILAGLSQPKARSEVVVTQSGTKPDDDLVDLIETAFKRRPRFELFDDDLEE